MVHHKRLRPRAAVRGRFHYASRCYKGEERDQRNNRHISLDVYNGIMNSQNPKNRLKDLNRCHNRHPRGRLSRDRKPNAEQNRQNRHLAGRMLNPCESLKPGRRLIQTSVNSLSISRRVVDVQNGRPLKCYSLIHCSRDVCSSAQLPNNLGFKAYFNNSPP